MDPRPQVIVIGAGIVGASVAWHLVRRGAAVTIIASDIGGTATRDSFSWLNATSGFPRPYYEFRRRSMAAWKRMAADVPGLSDIVQWHGSLQWDMAPEELARFEKEHSAWGYDIRRVDKNEMSGYEPYLNPEMLPDSGLRIGEEGAVEAAAAASLLITDTQAHGAKLMRTIVTDLLQKDGNVKGVILKSGEELHADRIVLAAGIDSVRLCAAAGIDLPATGKPGLLVSSKPLEKRLLNGLVLSHGLHIRQTVEGRLLAGTSYRESTTAEENDEQRAMELFARVKRIFNAADADKLQQDYFTVGIRPVPSDGLPILGTAGVDGLSLAVMHSGVTLAPIVGEILADEIVHGERDPAFEEFGLGRFKETVVQRTMQEAKHM